MKKKIALILLFTLVYAFTRFYGLGRDVINPDSIEWHKRSNKFFQALITDNLRSTYQKYHPGVTLMWLEGPTLKLTASWIQKEGLSPNYSTSNYLTYDYAAKSAIVIVSLFLSLLMLYLLNSFLKPRVVIIFSLFVLFEVFYIGMNRLFHLDFLMTELAFISFLYCFIYAFSARKNKFLVLSAVFFSLAILTKITALMYLPLNLGIIILGTGKLKAKPAELISYVLLASLFTFILFPALWVTPKTTILKVYNGVRGVGIEGQRDINNLIKEKNLIFGKTTPNTPWFFYLIALLYQMSPLLLTGFLASVFFAFYKGIVYIKLGRLGKFPDMPVTTKLYLCSLIYFLLPLIALSAVGKKFDRYDITLFPFLFICTALFVSRLKRAILIPICAIYVGLFVYQYLRISPYFYYYSDPFLGGLKTRYQLIGAKSFGVATYDTDKIIKEGAKNYLPPISVEGDESLAAIRSGYSVNLQSCPNCTFRIMFKQDNDRKVLPGYKLYKIIYVDNLDFWYIYEQITPTPIPPRPS